jgi:hypothetical protein
VRRFAIAALSAAAGLLVTGCGAEEKEGPSIVRPAKPAGAVALDFPEVGLRFSAPGNWYRSRSEMPGVATIASGEAVVSLWAHEQDEQPPRTRDELARVRPRLLAAVRRRDPAFGLENSRLTRVAGAPAIELRGRQRVGGRRMEVRSVHLYRGEAEYVVEALAPRGQFERVVREVLEPLLESLQASGEIDRA